VCSDAHIVYMVFSIYRGGDMVTGMQLHWSSKGDIPMVAVQNLTRQMFQGVEWLHQNNVVHRDVKADNYLLDRADLEHPECRVCLSDFGLAVEIQPDERLQSRCGTEMYWSPEFYDRNYALKVDVWAAGVTAYGLVTGSCAFQSEDQVRTKRVEVPRRCGSTSADFLLGVLKHNEAERLSASEALRHPFLAHTASAMLAADTSSEVTLQATAENVGNSRREGAKVPLPSASCKSEATTTASSCGSDKCESQQGEGEQC